ncbi:hypothetical protein [uncultured Polaribacter sp.]|uniref:hypothetical protein n=1 Tax=uncultured Polaribacter sp. TaxID=174711 RepID=UPI00262E6A17|nr:hypothetical protein [uncultured Polaribacter sp.]
MPKHYTFPYLFDENKSLSLTDLKKMGYLKHNRIISGTINWTSLGENSGSISIKVKRTQIKNYVEFDYTCNNESYNYKVYLVSVKSNLNEGRVLYFQCRFTGKRCRKLHLINGIFQHRTASKTGMYAKQTQSKRGRWIEQIYGPYFDSEKLYAELYSKHFKTHYKGKPTKRYLRLMQKINSLTCVY